MSRLLALCGALLLGLLGAAPARAVDLVEGAPFTGVIATFTGASIPTQVTIDWGDGSPVQPSAVALQPDKSGTVTSTHTYAKLGSVSVQVTDKSNPDVYERTTFTVKDAPVTGQGTTFKTAAAAGGVVVASFTDANTLGTAADFKVSIDWGDGTTTDGALAPRAGQPGQYDVTGAHAYPDGASYIVGISVKSTDGGDADITVQSTADGLPEASPPATGKILNFGRGSGPSMEVDEQGTANLVYGVPAPGRTGDDVVYCKLPRGAKGCAVKRTFRVDALTAPKILRDRNGTMRIVVSYNGVRQIGGGTLVISSSDAGATWDYAFFRVNTGLFQGSIIDAALSLDGRVLYALFGDFVPGDRSQTFAAIGLDRPILRPEANPGDVNGVPTYSARSVAVLPDGRAVVAGYDSAQLGKGQTPRAALRVVADADGNPVGAPWTPIRGGEVLKLAGNLRGTSLLGTPACDKGIEISSLRGLSLSAPRPLGADRSMACNAGPAADLTFDASGGRHMVYLSDLDGCQGKGPHTSAGTCIIYRRARNGADFGPKTTIETLDLVSARGLSVGAGADGDGWVAWQSLDETKTSTVESVRVTPTTTSSEQQVSPTHVVALALKPSAECSKSGAVTLSVQATGPKQGLPKISSVGWSSSQGLLPRKKADASAPFSTRFSVDRRGFRGLSSTGVIVFSMTVKARVKYRAGGKAGTANLSQVVSFFCGQKFSRVK